jgi:uncharacterized membrane protein
MRFRRTVGLTVLTTLLAMGACLGQTMKAGKYEVAALGTAAGAEADGWEKDAMFDDVMINAVTK